MRMRKQLTAVTLSFALLFGMVPTMGASAAKSISPSAKKLTITKGKGKTLKVKNTKKKVSWKVLSGKKCISLKKKGKTTVAIKGKKAGKAKVQAKFGKKKLTCTVTVKNAKKAKNTPKLSDNSAPTGSIAPTGSVAPSTSTSPTVTEQPADTPKPSTTPEPTTDVKGKNVADVAALKALIAEQRGRGATVSENLNGLKRLKKFSAGGDSDSGCSLIVMNSSKV